MCARDLLEVKGKGVRWVADKGVYTAHATDIISQRQYFVARSLISSFGNVFRMLLFSFYPQATDVGKTHRFAPTTVITCDYGVLYFES
jgi:hypothetical protein